MPETQKSLTSISPKAPIAIVAVAVLLGLAFDYLFFEKPVGISFPIMCLLVTVGLFAILQLAGRKPTWSEYWFLIPFLFFAAMVAVRASPDLAFFNVLASYAFLTLLIRVTVPGTGGTGERP